MVQIELIRDRLESCARIDQSLKHILSLQAPDGEIIARLLHSHIKSANFEIRSIEAGKSGAQVLILVEADRSPSLIKFGEASLIEREISGYDNFVNRVADSGLHPPRLSEVGAYGGYKSIAYGWAGGFLKVVSLSEYLLRQSTQPEYVEQLVKLLSSYIFEWQQPTWSYHLPRGLAVTTGNKDNYNWVISTIKAAFDEFPGQIDETVTPVLESIFAGRNPWEKHMNNQKASTATRLHGDLNIGNIVICMAASEVHPCLVDFACCTEVDLKNPICPARDWAKLSRDIQLLVPARNFEEDQLFCQALGTLDDVIEDRTDPCGYKQDSRIQNLAAGFATIRHQYIDKTRITSKIPEFEYYYYLLCWKLLFLVKDEYAALNRTKKGAVLTSLKRTIDATETLAKEPKHRLLPVVQTATISTPQQPHPVETSSSYRRRRDRALRQFLWSIPLLVIGIVGVFALAPKCLPLWSTHVQVSSDDLQESLNTVIAQNARMDRRHFESELFWMNDDQFTSNIIHYGRVNALNAFAHDQGWLLTDRPSDGDSAYVTARYSLRGQMQSVLLSPPQSIYTEFQIQTERLSFKAAELARGLFSETVIPEDAQAILTRYANSYPDTIFVWHVPHIAHSNGKIIYVALAADLLHSAAMEDDSGQSLMSIPAKRGLSAWTIWVRMSILFLWLAVSMFFFIRLRLYRTIYWLPMFSSITVVSLAIFVEWHTNLAPPDTFVLSYKWTPPCSIIAAMALYVLTSVGYHICSVCNPKQLAPLLALRFMSSYDLSTCSRILSGIAIGTIFSALQMFALLIAEHFRICGPYISCLIGTQTAIAAALPLLSITFNALLLCAACCTCLSLEVGGTYRAILILAGFCGASTFLLPGMGLESVWLSILSACIQAGLFGYLFLRTDLLTVLSVSLTIPSCILGVVSVRLLASVAPTTFLVFVPIGLLGIVILICLVRTWITSPSLDKVLVQPMGCEL